MKGISFLNNTGRTTLAPSNYLNHIVFQYYDDCLLFHFERPYILINKIFAVIALLLFSNIGSSIKFIQMMFCRNATEKCFKFNKIRFSRSVSYVQGQLHDNKIREYFYYIDHNGMVGITTNVLSIRF